MSKLLDLQRKGILKSDPLVNIFNVVNNVDKDACRIIMYFHNHLIPRRYSDVAQLRGGVRGIISDEQKYLRVHVSMRVSF